MMRVLFPDFCGPPTCAQNRNPDLAMASPSPSLLFPPLLSPWLEKAEDGTLNALHLPISHIQLSPGLHCKPPQPSGLECWSWEAGEKAVSPQGVARYLLKPAQVGQCPPPSAEL